MMKFTIAALVLVAVALASVEAAPSDSPRPRRCRITKKRCNKKCIRKGKALYSNKDAFKAVLKYDIGFAPCSDKCKCKLLGTTTTTTTRRPTTTTNVRGWGQAKCDKAAGKMAAKGCNEPPSFLMVQASSSCHFAAGGRGNADLVDLVLTDVSNETTLFTDRPYRNATNIATAVFDNKFEETFGDKRGKPNAVLTALIGPGANSQGAPVPIRVVVRQESSDLDETVGQLTYDVSQSASQEAVGAIPLGVPMSSCSLFIDSAVYDCSIYDSGCYYNDGSDEYN